MSISCRFFSSSKFRSWTYKHPSTDSSLINSLPRSGDSILERLVRFKEDNDLLNEMLEESPVSSASTNNTASLDELEAEPEVSSAEIIYSPHV